MKNLIEKLGIKMARCTAVNENPNMAPNSPMHHYKCILSRKDPRRQMTVFFSMGYAHSLEPEAIAILDCLASDSAYIDNCSSFEDWASEFGYDPDSRRAEKIFKACERNAEKLRQFMGDEYDELLQRSKL